MRSGSDDWVHANVHGILVTLEVLWVAGFLAVFVVYFIIKRRIKQKKEAAASERDLAE